ncbi:exodeoxyribonuclease III [Anaeromicrobium sediminis]|uniref:Exodeoxyribonuclease III n=1 Tax=Anaeromicrobium sediminis TaxID=1478221 RepID=A0A267MPH6_9FIRM|nr:exodeoxyribonuclease III [Anaeromicrobium sediminis]PAB60630.1 exodeoxyribonuclease III [Anaeromicrobium sediminis]
MKIYSWNVNGIRAVEKKGFIDWIKKENPDILGIQETKAHIEQLNEELIHIDGYESFFCSGERKGYSGVAVYTKFKPKSVKYGIGIEEFDNEGRILILEYDNFTFLNIYFPNGQKDDVRLDYKLRFYDAILDYCNDLREKGIKVVISGDYNTAHNEIDLKNPKSNEKRSGFLRIERDWIDKLVANGYIDTFRYLNPETIKYSWWSYRFNARKNNAGWRIDYHFVSEELKDNILGAEILNDVMGSDHCPVVLELKF